MIFSKYFSFETGSASPKTTAIGLCFAASVILFLSILSARMSYELVVTGQQAQGEVVQYLETGNKMQRAIFQFSDSQGRVHRVADSIQTSFRKYEIGDKLTLVYHADDPSAAYEAEGVWIYVMPIGLGVMSLLFYAGAALVWRFRSRFQKDYEARRGRTIFTTINNDGSLTQITRSSVPVFRGTGVFLAALGIVACFGAYWLGFHLFDTNDRPLNIIFPGLFAVMGCLLLLGAAALLRHARFLRSLEESTKKVDSA